MWMKSLQSFYKFINAQNVESTKQMVINMNFHNYKVTFLTHYKLKNNSKLIVIYFVRHNI